MITKRYHIWFVDIDGNDDGFTANLSQSEVAALTDNLRNRKDKQIISDYNIIIDSPNNYEETMDYINEKLAELEEDNG